MVEKRKPGRPAKGTPRPVDKKVLTNEAWRRGLLRWKLKAHQHQIYDDVWSAINKTNVLKYVVNCSRRFGKSFTLVLIAVEFALRTANVQVRFAAPTSKALKKIIFPILKIILEDCPEEVKPTFKAADDVLVFKNGSEIHFAGTDAGHAENLRGTASHLNILDEAGSMDGLEYVLKSILVPQTLTTGGTSILASTPSVTPAHDYYQIYRECLEDDNVSEFTIYDNTSLTPELIALYEKESGGKDSTTFKREYLCKFIVDSDFAIIPEWDTAYIKELEKDVNHHQYWHRYVALDIGTKDMTAAIFGYYNFRNATLYIEDEVVMNGPEMTTDKLAREIKDKEMELWGTMKPLRRIGDNNNLLLLQDLTLLHDLSFVPTNKETLEAMVNECRMWVGGGRVIIHPKCKFTAGCVQYGVWKDTSTSKREFARSKKYGHYDALAALIYLIRNIDVHTNPVPNTFGLNERTMFIDQSQYNHMSENAIAIASLFNK